MALAGCLSWLEHDPIDQNGSVAGSILSQGAFLGCGFNP